VGIHKTEEELKKSIFDIYSQLRKESSSDRRQVYFPQLLDTIVKWSIDYFYKKKTKEYWVEIRGAVLRIVKMDNTKKMPDNEHDLFKYLKVSLHRAKLKYIRKYEEEDNIHVSIGQKQKLKDIKEFIRMEESELGRQLFQYEKEERTAHWFNIPEAKARKYLDMIDTKKEISLETYNEEGKEQNILDSREDIKPPYLPSSEDVQEITFFSKIEVSPEKLRKAITYVLENKVQQRTRACNRALFTALCIKDAPKYLKELAPVLDGGLLSAYKKSGIKPTQYETYLIYHPNRKNKKSVEANASSDLDKFCDKIMKYLKENKS